MEKNPEDMIAILEEMLIMKDMLRSPTLKHAASNIERRLLWERAMKGISELDGDIRLGVTVNPLTGGYTPVGLKFEDLRTHVSIRGRSGFGKTNLALHIEEQISELGMSYIIYDKKADYIHLARKYANDNDFLVIDINDLRLNPFQAPPGYDQRKWIREVAVVFAEKEVLERSVNMMSGRAMDLFEKNGFAPSMYDVYASLLEHAPPRYDTDSRYFGSLMYMLGALLLAYPDTFACQSGYLSPDFMRKRVVIHIDNIDTHTQFILVYIWLWMFRHRKANALGGKDYPDQLLIIEEAQNFLPIEKPDEQTTEDMLIRECREFHIDIITLAQQTTRMNQTILANSATQIVCGVNSPIEFSYEKNALQLHGHLADELLVLPPDKHLVILPSGMEREIREPLLIESPLVDIRKNMTLDEVRETMRGKIAKIKYGPIEDELKQFVLAHAARNREEQKKRQEPAHKESRIEPVAKAEPQTLVPKQDTQSKATAKKKPEEVTFEGDHGKDASLVLQDIFKNVFSWDSQRYIRLDISNTTYKKALDILQSEGWIEYEPVEIWKGRKTKAAFQVPTRKFLTQLGKPWKGRGDYEHVYWQWRLAKHFKGEIEDGYADVSAMVDGVNIAFEVEMPSSVMHAGENAKRDLQSGFGKVFILYTKKKEEGEKMARGLKRSVKAKLGGIPENVSITEIWHLLEG